MTRGRTVVLVVGLVALLGVLAGTGGVSSSVVERGMQGQVVDDESAYLGFEQTSETVDGTTNLTVTVTNQFAAGISLTSVEVTVENETTDLGPLDAGEAASVTVADVDCNGTVAVEASGDGVDVYLDRPECG